MVTVSGGEVCGVSLTVGAGTNIVVVRVGTVVITTTVVVGDHLAEELDAATWLIVLTDCCCELIETATWLIVVTGGGLEVVEAATWLVVLAAGGFGLVDAATLLVVVAGTERSSHVNFKAWFTGKLREMGSLFTQYR
jgi:hypothetical protein